MTRKPQPLIDYAHPTMMAENALKELHDAMLMKRYEQAIEAGLKAIAETRIAIHAIRHEIERQTVKNDRRAA